MFCVWKKSPKEKKKQWFCESTFSQGSPIGKQNEICFFHYFPFQVCAGAWGEEKTQDEKEEQEGEEPQQQEQSNEVHAKKQERKEDQIRTT